MNETAPEPKRLCIVCDRRELANHEQQTCTHCLGRVRRTLIDVEAMFNKLPEHIGDTAGTAKPLDAPRGGSDESPIPGGDALALMAGGGTSTVGSRPNAKHPDGDRSHASDNLPSDPPSILATLASWEDDWRTYLGIAPAGWNDDSKGSTKDHRYAPRVTVTGCAVFLLRGLSHMAQHHPAFDEFAEDMNDLKLRLERVLREGDPRDRAEIDCPDCGGDIKSVYADPDPCPPGCTHDGDGHDQGGLRSWWMCRDKRCGRIVESSEYWLMSRQVKQDRLDRERAQREAS